MNHNLNKKVLTIIYLILGLSLSTIAQTPIPTLVKEINHPGRPSSPELLVNKQDTLYFVAFNDDFGDELWKSDGTESGTQMVKNAFSGPGEISFRRIISAGNLVFFMVRHPGGNKELWVSDGSNNGTYKINPAAAIDFNNLTGFDGYLYFESRSSDYGKEAWISDGTIAGTNMIKDIHPGTGSSSPIGFTLFKDEIYFLADDGSGHDLWKTDGTEIGTVKVSDIDVDIEYNHVLAIDSVLFFVASNSEHGSELWRSNGTSSGTYIVKDIADDSRDGTLGPIMEVNGIIYFPGKDIYGSELWRSDGTLAGTYLLKDIQAGQKHGFSGAMIQAGDMLYFRGDDGIHGEELWKTDGTPHGTMMVKDLNNSPYGSSIYGIAYLNNKVFFSANDSEHGQELFQTDGTEQGTKIVYDFHPDFQSFNPAWLTSVGDKLFMAGYDGSVGAQLYVLDFSTVSIEEEIEDWQRNHSFALYPNPAQDHIKLKAAWKQNCIYEISLQDITGKMLHSESINPQETHKPYHFELPTKLPAGYFLINIVENNHGIKRRVASEKVLIKR